MAILYIEFDPNDYEIVYNTNAMIPLPGTSQADHVVTILNK